MSKRILLLTLLNLVAWMLPAQELTQTVRGKVIDQQGQLPIPGATVIVVGTNPIIGAVSDGNGNFRLEKVPLGRQTIQITFVGYAPVVLSNLIVTSAKELVLNVELLEDVTQLEAIEVVASDDKDIALNDMASVSARTFSLDETMRFAGAFSDPARLVTNYAGVNVSGDVRNDIVVRGNSPSGIMYRIEGIPVPNPNHFGTFGTSGGAISMISQNMLANSDFLTGAFPSEYGNALAGVFDINFRSGNNEKREYVAQFGMRGLELSAEGPFSEKSEASYLINYRYSTLGIFDALGFDIGVPATPEYRDISFKVSLPFKNNNRLTIFGLGGIADIELFDSRVEPDEWFTPDKPTDLANTTRSAFVGATYLHFFNQKTVGELTLLFSDSFNEYDADTLSGSDYKVPSFFAEGEFGEQRWSVFYKVNKKFNAKNTLEVGLMTDFINGKFQEDQTRDDGTVSRVTDFDGNTTLVQPYVQWQQDRKSTRLNSSH